MKEAKCIYCKKYSKTINESQQCPDCEEQFKSIRDKVTKKNVSALKALADR